MVSDRQRQILSLQSCPQPRQRSRDIRPLADRARLNRTRSLTHLPHIKTEKIIRFLTHPQIHHGQTALLLAKAIKAMAKFRDRRNARIV